MPSAEPPIPRCADCKHYTTNHGERGCYVGGNACTCERVFAPPTRIPFQAHSGPSREAAVSIRPHAAGDRVRVLRYLNFRAERGATDDEMQRGLDLQESTQRPRRVGLVEEGLVIDSRKRRKTKRGKRPATVWMITQRGEAVVLTLGDDAD